MKRCTIFAAVAAIMTVSAAHAADICNDRFVRVISPFQPGSSPEFAARTITRRMSETLHKPFVIENRVGGLGLVAVKELSGAKADGCTLGYIHDGQMTILPAAYAAAEKKLPYDPHKDLVPIGMGAEVQFVVLANPNVPVDSLKELIAYAKATPKLSIGAPTPSGRLIGGLLKYGLGIDIEVIPNTIGGEPTVIGELISGRLQFAVSTSTSALEHVASGKVKIIGAVGKHRNPYFPNVQTFGEQGARIFDRIEISWGGLYGPPGTPQSVVDQYSAALRKALSDPGLVSFLRANGLIARYSTPQELTERLRDIPNMVELLQSTKTQLVGN